MPMYMLVGGQKIVGSGVVMTSHTSYDLRSSWRKRNKCISQSMVDPYIDMAFIFDSKGHAQQMFKHKPSTDKEEEPEQNKSYAPPIYV